MRVAYLTAGAAGMYCGSCMNDNTMARYLIKQGADVALLPTYTPIRTDEEDVSEKKVFLGGVNVYLKHKFPILRFMPRAFDVILNNRGLLNLVSRFSSATDAHDLGGLTVAVLEGRHGPLKNELEKLIHWLRNHFNPDLIFLTNAMFVGLAGRLQEALEVPVLCGLPGEDLFLDGLIEPYRSKALELVRHHAQMVDAFIAPSTYYQAHMTNYLQVPPARIHYVPLGLEMAEMGRETPLPRSQPFTIGYLARIAPEKGLHILVDAFIQLAEKQPAGSVRLRVAGYLGKKDQAYFDTQKALVEEAGLSDRVDWIGEVNADEKNAFFHSLHAFSVPTSYKEPKGRSVLEAMCMAVPVVQPRHGAFTALIEDSGGGLLVSPNDSTALAEGLTLLMDDEALRLKLAVAGRADMEANHTASVMARRAFDIFRHYHEEALREWHHADTLSGQNKASD